MTRKIELLQRSLKEGRAKLFQRVAWNAPCRDLLKAHAALVDGLVREIYEVSCRTADASTVRRRGSALAIVATGSYGRRELHPYSDIDIAFVPLEEEDPWVEALVHNAFRLVMDVFLSLRDVHVGYSFRPIAEVNAWDVKAKTALLDLRHVCGDGSLAAKLALRVRESLSPLDLMLESQPSADLSQGMARPSLYSVEPNLKVGPGSLRDLHHARWIFQLLLGCDSQNLDGALKDRAVIPGRQLERVGKAADWFLRARTWLHLASGKPSDVLIMNYQDRIARELEGWDAQEWLARHLEHSETLAEFRQTAVETLLRGPLDVKGILLRDGTLNLDDGISVRSRAANLFLLSQRYSIPLSLKLRRRLAEEQTTSLEPGEPSGDEIRTFHQILCERRAVASTLRALNDFGILDRFIPDYSKVMRFVPPDPAHRYTVGEHSMRMVAHLERLCAGRHPGEERFADLLNQCAHFDMLCLAALLHDAGKLLPGKEHSIAGAELAESVAARLRLAPEKRRILDLLVREHLLLVRTARLQDLKSTHVIRQAADRIPDLEALRHLYVFTYVDNSAVAENNWTSMDLRNLEDLYGNIQDHFSRRSDDGCVGTPEDQTALVRKKLTALQTRNESAVLKHCDAMPAGYVLNTPLEEIAFHLQLLDRLETEGIVLDVYNRPGDDYSELTLCTLDDPRPGILAKIAGVLYGCGVDIHKAQAFTMKKETPVVLDTLWISCNGTQISENKARRIRSALRDVLTGARTVEEFLEHTGKVLPAGIVLETIDLRNDLSEEHTVVHIVAPDQQGLLYWMTRSISRRGLYIHSAKITTWNARAENNFYVSSITGGRIPDRDLPIWTEQLAQSLRGSPLEV